MIMNEFGTRRSYDDRYETLDGWPRQNHVRRAGGDWMREQPWMRDPSWLREPGWAWGREPYGWGGREYGWSQPWGGQPWGYGRELGLGYGQPYAWGREPAWLRMQELGYEPMVKVIEIVAESPHSWEDATRRAIAEASQTVRGIRSIHVEEMQAVTDEDHVLGFRIHAKIAYAGVRR